MALVGVEGKAGKGDEQKGSVFGGTWGPKGLCFLAEGKSRCVTQLLCL